jgi:hypothetical protein
VGVGLVPAVGQAREGLVLGGERSITAKWGVFCDFDSGYDDCPVNLIIKMCERGFFALIICR